MRSGDRVVVALVAAGLLAAGCGTATMHRPAARPARPVPWLDRPAPAFEPPPPPKLVAAFRPCQAWQLAATPGQGGPAAGTVFQDVRLTNRGDHPCTLSGGPTAVTGIGAAGGLFTLWRASADPNLSLAGPGPANIRPGQSGWVTLSYPDGCPAITSGGKALYRTLFIGVGGGFVRVRFQDALNVVCGLAASLYGVPPPPDPSSRSPLNVLTAIIGTRATFRGGGTATFTITLRNRGDSTVRLAPCPSYTEFLGVSSLGKPAYVVRHFYLNCAAIRRIAARRSVTFAMRMPVPAKTGQAKLDWQLQDSDVASAVIVTISR